MSAMMQAMDIAEGALRAVTLPIPAPQAHEVQIRVAYAGVNHADLLQVAGKYASPKGASPLPGLEVSGTITALGKGVRDWQIGDRVGALLSGGGYAEFVTAPTAQCLALPPSLALDAVATLPEAVATSMMALGSEANLQSGETVLLHGGTSGVGLVMGQIAKGWGAKVLATVGSKEKAAVLRALGITPINHRDGDVSTQVLAATGKLGVDVIIDILGAPKLTEHLQLLKKNGRLVSLAMLEGSKADGVKLAPILLKHLQIRGATLRSRSDVEKAALTEGVRQHIWPLLTTGELIPRIDKVFPLLEAQKALAAMQERLHIGKILLEVAPNAR